MDWHAALVSSLLLYPVWSFIASSGGELESTLEAGR